MTMTKLRRSAVIDVSGHPRSLRYIWSVVRVVLLGGWSHRSLHLQRPARTPHDHKHSTCLRPTLLCFRTAPLMARAENISRVGVELLVLNRCANFGERQVC